MKIVKIFAGLMIVVGIFFRIWHLNTIPAGLYYDEMDSVFLGESVARFGTDITGAWSPLQLRPLNSLNLNAELPSIFHALAQKIVGFGGAAAHIPNAFFGLMTGVVVIALVKALTGKWSTALLSGGLLLTNPWHVHVSRTAYEAGISIFFQTLIILGFVWFEKSKKLIWKVVSIGVVTFGIFFGFFTYHGAKFTIPAIVLFMTIYLFNKYGKQKLSLLSTVILPLFLCLILGGYYIYLSNHNQLKNRQNELIFSSEFLKSEVDLRRRISVNFPGKSIVINKGTILVEEVVKRYLFIFDTRRLFSQGTEDTFQFSLFVYPYFYLTTLFFLILGFYYCLKIEKYLFLVGLVLISPVTSLITQGYQSIFRSGLTYICLIVVAGIGMGGLIEDLDNKAKKILILGIFGVMIVEMLLFFGNYFGRYPIVTADNHYFSEKLLSGYLGHLDQKVIIISSSPYTLARSIVVYLQLIPSLSISQRVQLGNVGAGEFDLGNITVTANCPKLPISTNLVVISDLAKRDECNFDTKTAIQLASPIDSGTYYFIYNDLLCEEVEIASYVYVININYFDVTNLSSDQLCHNWMRLDK